MKDNYLDKAFNWLVLLLGTITAAICQFPTLIPFYQQTVYREGEEVGPTIIVRLMVFPILVLVILWLAGSLARKLGAQVFWKSLSWIYASLILAADIVFLLVGSVPVIQQMFSRQEVGILQSTILLELIIAVPFYLFVIRPRMREVYEDSRLVRSLPAQVLLGILGFSLYILAVGFVEQILGVGPF